MKPYRVALIQQQTRVIVEPKERNEIIDENLDRIFELLDWTALRLGDVKLAVFSEYSIIGQYRPRSVDEWLALAETIPGDVTDQIGRKAKERGCYIVGNLYERDDDWPGRLFNTSFIVDPDGEIILKYRKNNGPNNLNTTYTGPGDVYSEYTERYGEDSMFPVADTDIGRLGCLTCTDVVFPEMARCLALRGAEVLIHPTAEPYAPEGEAWDVLRRARAYENLCYFLSVNAGAFVGSNRPTGGYRGMTQVIDYMGHVQSAANGARRGGGHRHRGYRQPALGTDPHGRLGPRVELPGGAAQRHVRPRVRKGQALAQRRLERPQAPGHGGDPRRGPQDHRAAGAGRAPGQAGMSRALSVVSHIQVYKDAHQRGRATQPTAKRTRRFYL